MVPIILPIKTRVKENDEMFLQCDEKIVFLPTVKYNHV